MRAVAAAAAAAAAGRQVVHVLLPLPAYGLPDSGRCEVGGCGGCSSGSVAPAPVAVLLRKCAVYVEYTSTLSFFLIMLIKLLIINSNNSPFTGKTKAVLKGEKKLRR